MDSERLVRCMAFVREADRLRGVLRRTNVICEERLENSAEHSWYLTLMAMTLAEFANESIDTSHVLRMLVIHDLVEIDAGDTFAYDTAGYLDKREREEKAADRLFGLLPEDIGAEFRALWEEFEVQETAEAKFAGSIDRLGGMFPNYCNQGGTWGKAGISAERVTERNQMVISDGSRELWKMAESWIAEAKAEGWIQ